MNKWLSSFLTETPRDRTDKGDILPKLDIMSLMSVPSCNVSSEISPSRGSEPRLPSKPGTDYCDQCGGGYWLRFSHESAYQCGRCFPSGTRVETLLIPGGTLASDRVRLGESTPQPPIQPGWLVTHQDKTGNLCGGSEDREHGTVQENRWDAGRWLVCLTDGQRVPLSLIRTVGQTDPNGRLCAAWTVRERGYDGRKQEARS